MKTKGTNVSVNESIVARVSFEKVANHACFLPVSDGEWCVRLNDILLVDRIKAVGHLVAGDIVVIHNNGLIRTLYRRDSNTNSLFLTERCNSNCLMCSQPPMDWDDIPKYISINSELIRLIPKDCRELGMTGGEPTLLGEGLIDLVAECKFHLPQTSLHILTNARRLATRSYAKALSDVAHDNLVLGIPLFSHDWRRHDYAVQAKDAWFQTMKGIFNCKDFGLDVEIRIILEKPVVEHLWELTDFILQNLPFVKHVAFMGLEVTGYTKANLNSVWMEPLDYASTLEKCVHKCSKGNLNVSIYNLQYCLLPPSVRGFARKSISEWKNDFLDDCVTCSERENCGGFFTTGMSKLPKGIKAIAPVVTSQN